MCEPVEHCVASLTLGTGRILSPLFPFLHGFLNGWYLCFIVVSSDPVFAKYKIIERRVAWPGVETELP